VVTEITSGTGFTWTVAVFVNGTVQEPKAKLLNVNVTSVVGAATITIASPEAAIVIDCVVPPLIV